MKPSDIEPNQPDRLLCSWCQHDQFYSNGCCAKCGEYSRFAYHAPAVAARRSIELMQIANAAKRRSGLIYPQGKPDNNTAPPRT